MKLPDQIDVCFPEHFFAVISLFSATSESMSNLCPAWTPEICVLVKIFTHVGPLVIRFISEQSVAKKKEAFKASDPNVPAVVGCIQASYTSEALLSPSSLCVVGPSSPPLSFSGHHSVSCVTTTATTPPPPPPPPSWHGAPPLSVPGGEGGAGRTTFMAHWASVADAHFTGCRTQSAAGCRHPCCLLSCEAVPESPD